MSEELYYLQNKHAQYLGNAPVWYGAKGGYTAYVLGARKFTKEELKDYLGYDDDKWAAFKCKDIEKRLHLVFDSQDFRRLGTNEPSGWSYANYHDDAREFELLATIEVLREALDHLYDAQTTEETCGYYIHGMKKAKQALEKTKDIK